MDGRTYRHIRVGSKDLVILVVTFLKFRLFLQRTAHCLRFHPLCCVALLCNTFHQSINTVLVLNISNIDSLPYKNLQNTEIESIAPNAYTYQAESPKWNNSSFRVLNVHYHTLFFPRRIQRSQKPHLLDRRAPSPSLISTTSHPKIRLFREPHKPRPMSGRKAVFSRKTCQNVLCAEPVLYLRRRRGVEFYVVEAFLCEEMEAVEVDAVRVGKADSVVGGSSNCG
ncbi:hypothetical protein ACQKWADRAFT_29281 [Trichoderma austrokoningii]